MNERLATGLFTLGVASDSYRLPHPRLGLPVILLVRRVLLRAFDVLRESGFNLADASEDQVTAALRSTVENNLRQNGSVLGFNVRTFDAVVRQGQCANYDGTRLTKTPDLCFRLRYDEGEPRPVISEHDALFIECKPIDVSHAAGGKYCDDGLCRFVDGDYAWAMTEGLMLGYARDGRTIAQHLLPAMTDAARHSRLKTVHLPSPVDHLGAAQTPTAEALYRSVHQRGFPWPDEKGLATEILIYHTWHSCS